MPYYFMPARAGAAVHQCEYVKCASYIYALAHSVGLVRQCVLHPHTH